MRFLILCFVTLLYTGVAGAQDIEGQWNGLLKVQGMQLRLVFHVTKSGEGYSSTMDSPDQGAMGMPVTATTYQPPTVRFEIIQIGFVYEGQVNGTRITGSLTQRGQSFPMDLSRDEVKKEEIRRPQMPVAPYPYRSEEVSFRNESAGIALAGTLTLPEGDGRFPAVVLISGSGPQDRDESLLGHKPFLVLSDYLTRQGIAVLRFDDRGVAQSEGTFETGTTVDFASDAKSAVAYLMTREEIDHKHIGLIGHSEGGIIAPIVAAESKEVAFVVLLAGTGIRGDQLLLLQQKLILAASGASEEDIMESEAANSKFFELILENENQDALKELVGKELTKMYREMTDEERQGMTEDAWIDMEMEQMLSPWMQFFIRYDPAPTLEKVKCPVLAVNGEKDLQVPPKENISAIEAALKDGGNKKVTTIIFPGLNHLFQECTTGSPSEYAEIEQTLSPVMMDSVGQWILKTVK